MNAIIVDDEFLAREELKYFIKNFSDIDIKGEFENGVEVLKYLQENKVDVIFLDINIPLLDGVVLAKNISKFSEKPYIVFITAYKEYASEAFEIEAFDYILKPFEEKRIISMLKKIEIDFKEKNEKKNKLDKKITNRINVWKDEKIIIVDISDINYCEARERTTDIYTNEGTYSINMSISEFYETLPRDIFFKTHRSYIVNLTKVKEIIPWFNNTYNLKLKDIEDNIPVSRSHIKDFRSLMNI